MVWVPYTKTNGQWIASKLLQGFFGAPIESLCEISVTDIVRPSATMLSARYSDSFSISRTKGELTSQFIASSSSLVIFSRRFVQVSSMRDKDGSGFW